MIGPFGNAGAMRLAIFTLQAPDDKSILKGGA